MTIEDILACKESQTFDCKSIQIDPKALAIPVVAMANADGGVLALTAEWTTEMEFDRPSTRLNDDTVKVQINSAKLTDRQRKIFETIKYGTVNGTVNAQNLSIALGISLRTTKRDLYILRDMKLIRYVGSDKTGHWEVIS